MYQKWAVNQVLAQEPRRNHKAIHEKGQKKECVQCKSAGKKTPKGYPVKTINKCQQCGVGLCKVQCFADYHSEDTWT